MSHKKYATINLSETELIIIQDLISKEKRNLDNRLCSGSFDRSGQTSLKNILESELQICKDLNFVFKTELQKF